MLRRSGTGKEKKSYVIKVALNLTKVSGNVPSKSPELFKEIVEGIIEQWDIKAPVDIMSANRMVSAWMKMRYCEDCINKYGLFFEEKDSSGTINRIRMNELAYYLKQLDSEFRAYYRLLNSRYSLENKDDGPKDFFAYLDATAKEVQDDKGK